MRQELGIEEEQMNEEKLNRALSLLSPREEKIIRMRYGLSPSRHESTVLSSQEISRERIREIERKALERLRDKNRTDD